MGYRLLITRRAEDLLDNLVGYLLLELGNKPAAVRLLDGVEKIYCRLEQNPFQFPVAMTDICQARAIGKPLCRVSGIG